MNFSGLLWRFLISGVAVAVAIRVTWLLIQPEVPAIVVVIVGIGIVRAVSWYRGRW